MLRAVSDSWQFHPTLKVCVKAHHQFISQGVVKGCLAVWGFGIKFLDLGYEYLTAMREYPRNSRTGAIRERRSIAAGTLEQLPGNRAINWVLRGVNGGSSNDDLKPTLARNTGRGPRDTPSMRVTGRRTSKRQPKKPGVSVVGDIEGQTFQPR